MARVVSAWGTRIRGSLQHSIAKASPGFFECGAANQATDYDEQIRVPCVLKNIRYPAVSDQVWAINPPVGGDYTAGHCGARTLRLA